MLLFWKKCMKEAMVKRSQVIRRFVKNVKKNVLELEN